MPSEPQTGSCGVLMVGHERGQFAEIALFLRPPTPPLAAAAFAAEADASPTDC